MRSQQAALQNTTRQIVFARHHLHPRPHDAAQRHAQNPATHLARWGTHWHRSTQRIALTHPFRGIRGTSIPDGGAGRHGFSRPKTEKADGVAAGASAQSQKQVHHRLVRSPKKKHYRLSKEKKGPKEKAAAVLVPWYTCSTYVRTCTYSIMLCHKYTRTYRYVVRSCMAIVPCHYVPS